MLSSLEGYSFDGDEFDSGVRRDATVDAAAPPDARSDADISEDAGDEDDAGPDECGGCSGARPICDAGSAMCVECLSNGDCSSGTCEAGNCNEATQLALGLTHSCALLEDGAVWCWGGNHRGQVGDGSMAVTLTPTMVASLPSVRSIATGSNWTCALTNSEEIYCWGSNLPDEDPEPTLLFGAPTPELSTSPLRVGGIPGAIALSGGNDFACAVTAARESYCWGTNWGGQLGNNTFDWDGSFDRVQASAGPATLDEIACGGGHTCGRDGMSVVCWGYNDFGQAGTGDMMTVPSARAVSTGAAVRTLSLGDVHSCLVADDGVYCWGDNPDGRLGDGSTVPRNTPLRAIPGSNFAGVTAGRTHTCAWTDDGVAQCWGDGGTGQYGDGTAASDLALHRVALSDVASVVAGGLHNCALTANAEVHCWGQNDTGQLGDGTTRQRLSPVRVAWP
ncbi:MAG: hypothetical protein SangKO_093520 [Sandaracinaceae bacterium]